MVLDQDWALTDCEEELERQIGSGRKALLGEVELGEDEVHHLGRLLGDALRSRTPGARLDPGGDGDCVRRVWQQWGYCAACLTVGVFTLNWEEEGHFWPALGKELGVKLRQSHQTSWREWFEGFLSRSDLPSFWRVPGQRLMKQVRIHAALPYEGAKRVFQQVVVPALERELPLDDLSAGEVLDMLGLTETALRRPAHDFLRYGDQVADDLLRRCAQLCREALMVGNVGDHLGLPDRVVRAFEDWLCEERARGRPGPRLAEQSERVPRPFLQFDDWGDVVLVLPPRPVGKGVLGVWAQVGVPDGGGGQESLNCELIIDAHKAETREQHIVVPQPADKYEVAYCEVGEAANRVARDTVRLSGVWQEGGLEWVAFDGDGRRIASHVLPRREVWFLGPSGAELLGVPKDGAEGEAAVEPIERMPLNSWAGWSAMLVDTSALRALVIRQGARDCVRIGVDISPRLTLEPLRGVTSEGRPVLGQPPCCEEAEVVGVSVDVEDLDLGSPGVRQVFPPEELPERLRGRAGAFRVTVRGRLGRRSRTEFALLPAATVRFAERLWAPSGERPVKVYLGSPALRKAQTNAPQVRVRRVGDEHVVTAPWDARRIHLNATIADGAHDALKELALDVAVPRVLVALGGPRLEESRLGLDHVKVDSEDIASGRDLVLWVAIHPRPERASGWEATLRTEPQGWRMQGTRRGSRIAFDLNAWRDALKGLPRSQELWVDVTVGTKDPVPAQVGSLVLTPVLRRVSCETRQSVVRLLSYQVEGPEVEAKLRLTCFTYPWLPDFTCSLPRDDRGRGSVELPQELPAGEYVCEVLCGADEARDLVPDPAKGRRVNVPFALGVAFSDEPFQRYLRRVADLWAPTWTLSDDMLSFDLDEAQRADAEARQMGQTGTLCPSNAEDLRATAILMLWWMKQAQGAEHPLSTMYARLAVRHLMSNLCSDTRTSEALLKCVQQIAQEAGPASKTAARELLEFVQSLLSLGGNSRK